MNTPSDEEIDAFLDSPADFAWVIAGTRERYRMLVREVFAKWGKPRSTEREPLTDEEIADFVGEQYHNMTYSELKWFRLGEAAHGITQKGGSNADT
jgi:hypothetical protein